MAEPTVTPATVLAGYRRFGELAAALAEADLDRPTRLPDWSIRHLLAHVAWAQAMEADALRRRDPMRPGVGEASQVPPGSSLTELVAALETGHQHLAAALSRPVETEQALVAVPAGTLPVDAAVVLFSLEAGLHAADLAHAVGMPDGLTPDEVAACWALVDPMLELGAARGAVPTGPVAVEIRGDRSTLTRVWRDGTWQREGSPPDTVLVGSDEALALFLYGRGSWQDLGVAVIGEVEVADRFKEWFPGP